MIPRVIKKAVDLNRLQKTDKLDGPLYELENGGHTFEITVTKGRTAAAVSGTVSVRFIRADNVTVSFTGTASANVVSVTLPQSCYTVPGHFGMVVFVSGSGTTDAVYACAGHVARSTSDAVIDPEENIPSLEELLAQIEACEQATNNANNAVSYIAPVYSDNTVYKAGDYAIRDGKIYRRLTDASTVEGWTPANWTEVTATSDLTSVIKAQKVVSGIEANMGWESGGLNPASGIEYASQSTSRTAFLPVKPGEVIRILKDATFPAPQVFWFASNAETQTGVNESTRVWLAYDTDITVPEGKNYMRIRVETPLADIRGRVFVYHTQDADGKDRDFKASVTVDQDGDCTLVLL